MGGISSASSGIGSGQTWQNVTASRAVGSTYTNTSGKPIMVVCSTFRGGATLGGFTFQVDGVTVPQVYSSSSNCTWSCYSIVPNGSTYGITSANDPLSSWVELRS